MLTTSPRRRPRAGVNGSTTRYADPAVCPDCGALLPVSPRFCPSCHLPLQGPLALELLETLTRADVLLGRLRSEATVEEIAPAPGAAPAPDARAATADPVPRPRTGLRTASVPAILLSLGALCLIVAAVTFLAVAWSWMGVGGRTGVLVGLTAAAAGAGVVLGGRGLRVAAESLTTVSLGLVALDVVGAITANWLGSPEFNEAVALVGAGVAIVAGMMVAVGPRLVAPQVGAALGLWAAAAGTAASGHDAVVAFGAVLVLTVVAVAGRAVGARVLEASANIAAVTWWLWLLGSGVESIVAYPTVHSLWVEGEALPLLGAAVLLLVPLAVFPGHAGPARFCLSGAATLVTLVLAVPALDETATAVGVTALITLLAWSGAALALPRSWRPIAIGPLGLAALPALALVFDLVTTAALRLGTVGLPFEHGLGVQLADPDSVANPLLLVPLVVALLLATWVLRPELPVVLLSAPLVALAAFSTLASYAVPLALPVAILALVAVAIAAAPGTNAGRDTSATILTTVAVACALPSAGLTAATCAVGIAVSVLLRRSATPLPGIMLPAAFAGLIWSAAEVAGVAVELRALPVLVVCGGLAIVRPRAESELTAAVCGLVASAASVAAATDPPTALAIHLTVAGALVTLSSLVHPDRRVLAWPGGALLAAATWVRLADLGVDAPEAYTLPSAVVLIMVALHRLWRVPESSTAALLPGLILATVPSLLWVLVDPVSPRAVLLGLACLGLVLTGTRLGWSAPLAVGSLVGGVLVAREVAPYTSELPQWVMIGLAGGILTVVGVTWERRLLQMRRAAAYVGRLR